MKKIKLIKNNIKECYIYYIKMSILMRNHIRMIVLDMESVLFNEKRVMKKVIKETMKDLRVNTRLNYDKWPGLTKKTIIKCELDKYGEENDINYLTTKAMIEEGMMIMEKKMEKKYLTDNKIELVDKDVLKVLDTLKALRIKICMTSEYDKRITNNIMSKYNIFESINDYTTKENMKLSSPSPFMITKMMERLDMDDVRNLCQVSGNMEYLKIGDKLNIGMKIGVLSGTADKRELDVKTNMRYKTLKEINDGYMGDFYL